MSVVFVLSPYEAVRAAEEVEKMVINYNDVPVAVDTVDFTSTVYGDRERATPITEQVFLGATAQGTAQAVMGDLDDGEG